MTPTWFEAAHIYPVSASGSHDEPWNGIALCPNHHLAFDRHLLAVHPETREITFSPVIHSQVPHIPAMRAFVEGTFARLAEPKDNTSRPVTSMFSERYLYYPRAYTWMSSHVKPVEVGHDELVAGRTTSSPLSSPGRRASLPRTLSIEM